jgi:hypothetical protein
MHEVQATQSTKSLLFPANSPLASSPMPSRACCHFLSSCPLE